MSLFNSVRERTPPRGNIGVHVEGILHYRTTDRAGRVHQEGEVHNLVLDSGRNLLAVNGVAGVLASIGVGTGTTEPNIGQTSFVAVAMRKAAAVTTPTVRVSDGVWDFTSTVTFGYSEANGNLTEWGVAPATTGNLFSRELFRDGSGNAIVVSKSSDLQLQLTYTLRMTNTPVVPTAGNITITGAGTYPLKYVTHFHSSGASDRVLLDKLIRGEAVSGNNGMRMFLLTSAPGAYTYTAFPAAVGNGQALAFPAYVTGSFQRVPNQVTFEPGTQTGTIYGVGIEIYSFDHSAIRTLYTAWFDTGNSFAKGANHRVTILPPIVSWG